MIEEQATVVEIGPGHVWVETRRRTTCGACTLNKGCGTAALAKALGGRRARVKVLSDLDLVPGEGVIIGLHEQALVRGSLAVYLLPLLAMLGGALSGQSLFEGGGEEPVVLSGALGLLAGFVWLGRYARRIGRDPRYQPVVLRRLGRISSPMAGVPAP